MNLPPKVTDRAYARLAEIARLTGQTRALRVAVEGGAARASSTTSSLMTRRPMTSFWNVRGKRCWSMPSPCPFCPVP